MNEYRPIEATRWGGIALAISALTLLVTICLYVFVLGEPAPASPGAELTPLDRASHILENWTLAAGLWTAESLAFVLMAVSALTLLTGGDGGARWLPRRAGWAAIAIGAVLQAGMYAFMLGGYPAAIEAVETVPELFVAFGDAAFFLFYLSNAAIFFGLLGIFIAEAGPGGVLPMWLGWTGAVVSGLGFVILLGLIGGFGNLVMAGPFALLGYALTAYLGFSIARGGSRGSSPGRQPR